MKNNTDYKNAIDEKDNLLDKNISDGGTVYPDSEDIYKQSKEEINTDPEDISKIKRMKILKYKLNKLNYAEGKSGEDLDVPGAELDNAMEEIGSEDEENNFYSLGGDNHNNLEEDNGQ